MTETRVQTLSEFLLVRIAEDEAIARKSLADRGAASWNPKLLRAGIPEARMLIRFDPQRMSAECEAKRRIVIRLALEVATEPESCRCFSCMTLVELALPYADHRDYREEWRP